MRARRSGASERGVQGYALKKAAFAAPLSANSRKRVTLLFLIVKIITQSDAYFWPLPFRVIA